MNHAEDNFSATLVPEQYSLSLVSPVDYQVCQRHTPSAGRIPISGRVDVQCDSVVYRLTGPSTEGVLSGDWVAIHLDPLTGIFTLEPFVAAGGWYRLEVRGLKGKRVVSQTEVPHIGVGEVFVGAGQSNAANHGEGLLQPETGLVATFGGDVWRLAYDPQPGASGEGGSFWPAFGDALSHRYGVPIGVAVTSVGGSSVNQWQPSGVRFDIRPTAYAFVREVHPNLYESEGQLFDGLVTRMFQLGWGGFRAVLWHQGESDANQPQGRAMTSHEYAGALKRLLQATRQRVGWEFPWFVAQASYHTPDEPKSDPIRMAQQSLWQSHLALPGPDTDQLVGDLREGSGQGVHFSHTGLKVHGQKWAEKVSAWLDVVLTG